MTQEEEVLIESTRVLVITRKEAKALLEKAREEKRSLTMGEKWQIKELEKDAIKAQERANEVFVKAGENPRPITRYFTKEGE